MRGGCGGHWRQVVRVLVLLTLTLLPVLASNGHAAAGAPCLTRTEDLRFDVSGVTVRGDLLLADGREVRLAWLDSPEAFLARRKVWLEGVLAGDGGGSADIYVRDGGAQDRWGQTSAVVDVRVPAGMCASLQEKLLHEGLARLRPEGSNEPATAELASWRLAEQAAEKARLGLWGAIANAPLSAAAPGAILAQKGQFVIVEGVVASVNERASQTYLNFGSRWSEDMTVSAPARIWRILARSGLTAARLQGNAIRVRGIVESRGGPLIELASPAELEVAGTGSRP